MPDAITGNLIARLAQTGATPSQQAAIQLILDGRNAAQPPGDKAAGFLDQKGAMAFLRCSRTQLYFLRRQGLRTLRIGRKLLFKADELAKFVEELNAK